MTTTWRDEGLVLKGLNGSNPLGFLAALGTLRSLSIAWHERQVLMTWRKIDTWRPVIHGADSGDGAEERVLSAIGDFLSNSSCAPAKVDRNQEEVEAKREERRFRDSKKQFDTQIKRIKETLKAEGLRGRKASEETDRRVKNQLAELEREVAMLRAKWRTAIERSAPARHVSLGQNLSVTSNEFRAFVGGAADAATLVDRTFADFAASYGCEVLVERKQDRIQSTPFCFITGSGHQHFLETMANLMEQTRREHLQEALFGRWRYENDGLCMRWDPSDAREYALQWQNPSDYAAKTVWGANRLAVEALPFFPAFPDARRLATTGFSRREGVDEFTWPVWTRPINSDTVRSLVARAEFQQPRPDRRVLGALGVGELYRSRRIQLGNPPLVKISFSPAECV
jgi:hypothetical protein